MNHRTAAIVLGVVCMSLVLGFTARAQEIETLKGLATVRAVFDVRSSTPQSAARQLTLIHQTIEDLASMGKTADFKVVFSGPAVKFLSSTPEGFTEEDRKVIGQVSSAVSILSKDGVGLEICRVAMGFAKVDPATVLPEIKAIQNGWYSLIGYQAQGYSLVAGY